MSAIESGVFRRPAQHANSSVRGVLTVRGLASTVVHLAGSCPVLLRGISPESGAFRQQRKHTTVTICLSRQQTNRKTFQQKQRRALSLVHPNMRETYERFGSTIPLDNQLHWMKPTRRNAFRK